ncbi:DUF6907 domain-containing protein [Streptomyces sp. NPDC058992]|uniref:DUF6907 domain-containing protein n=1 Tax=Streptomyces sp. NPDC058992 TaxID=3346688 RepID=UPI00369FBB39
MSITVPSPDKGSATSVPASFRPSGSGLLPGIPAQPAPEQAADASGRPGTRLVPAKIGRPGRIQTVYIECPEWCETDHSEREGSLDDVMHYGSADSVLVSTLTDDVTAHGELHATIAIDPAASDHRLRTAHIVVADGQPTDAYLSPEMGEELADDLIAFAAQLRHKARLVRLFNQARGEA